LSGSIDESRADPARRLVRARWLVVDDEHVVRGGALVVAHDRIEEVLLHHGARPARPCDEVVDLGDAVLTAGLVDAHAHLELTELCGRVARGADFPSWIRALIAARAGLDESRSVARGLELLAESGTVAIGDVANTWCEAGGAFDQAARSNAPLVVVHREVLDAGDEARGSAAAERAAALAARPSAPWRAGLSPHAPYTTLDSTLARCATIAREHDLPVQIHWAETAEEEEWLAGRSGPFDALLGPPRVRAPLLERLERSGLLGPRTVLVHGNHAHGAAPARLAASGLTLVHCPGTHRFFERAPFPFERWLSAGVTLALGTDSLASNSALDMRRELALAARAAPQVPARVWWRMATRNGARALGVDDVVGVLAAGRPFTAAAFATAARDEEQLFRELVRDEPPLVAAWVAGRRVDGPAVRAR
jgi:cytosine/adenosine deaminase-related metal-dependent hydrolase